MTPERWKQLKAVLVSALERSSPEDRHAYVEAACAGDPALRSEVESLLAARQGLASDELDEASLRLGPGMRLGPYDVLGALGTGGMGEVYRARDSRLEREVALKLVRGARAFDPQMLARLRREAQLLAALSHPNIGTIHEVEESAGVTALVLELVEGETLAERIRRGPLPPAEALAIARQIAVGLEAAHARGIVHRDLKPQNVKLTPEGGVKLLDFGLAGFDPRHPEAEAALGPRLTRAGTLLGTPAYASPEQAVGGEVDQRADIWAFGVVLWEMLTGRQPFQAESVAETLGAVLRAEPDWSLLSDATPAPVRRLLQRCLERDPRNRLHHIADARLELDEALRHDERPRRRTAARHAAWALLAAAAGGFATYAARGLWDAPRERPLRRLAIPDAGFLPGYPAAIAPDGRHIVYTGGGEPFGEQPLYVRSLNDVVPRQLPGTSGARHPFFSPDGGWIAFFQGRHLWRIELCSRPRQVCGTPQQIVEADLYPDGTGVWADDGTIVMSRAIVRGRPWPGLARVRPETRDVEPLTSVDTARGERFHLLPEVLPQGGAVLFTVTTRRGFRIDAVARDGSGRRVLLEDATTPRYAASGHLLAYRPGSRAVHAARLDASTVKLVGPPVTVLDDVMRGVSGGAGYAVARDGTLIYSDSRVEASDWQRQLVRITRNGAVTPLLQEVAAWSQPRLSPDGRTLLLRKLGTPNCDLWSYEPSRGVLTRLTSDTDAHDPVWHPGGRHVATSAGRPGGGYAIQSRAMPGGEPGDAIASGPEDRRSPAWSADGRQLAFTVASAATGLDLWISGRDGRPGEQLLLGTEFDEDQAVFSPDGRAIAYTSDESGRSEVYVRGRDAGSKLQLSSEGGSDPLWSRDGKELFFLAADRARLMAARALGGDRFEKARPLFAADFIKTRELRNYDAAPDGREFVVVRRAPGRVVSQQLHVVVDWLDELRRQAKER